MRNLKNVVVMSALSLAAGIASAVPPTTAAELAASVDLSDAKAAGLIIVGLMVAVGIALWGARLVMAKFTPKV